MVYENTKENLYTGVCFVLFCFYLLLLIFFTCLFYWLLDSYIWW